MPSKVYYNINIKFLKNYIQPKYDNLVAIGNEIVTMPKDNTMLSFYINYYYGVKLIKTIKRKICNN